MKRLTIKIWHRTTYNNRELVKDNSRKASKCSGYWINMIQNLHVLTKLTYTYFDVIWRFTLPASVYCKHIRICYTRKSFPGPHAIQNCTFSSQNYFLAGRIWPVGCRLHTLGLNIKFHLYHSGYKLYCHHGYGVCFLHSQPRWCTSDGIRSDRPRFGCWMEYFSLRSIEYRRVKRHSTVVRYIFLSICIRNICCMHGNCVLFTHSISNLWRTNRSPLHKYNYQSLVLFADTDCTQFNITTDSKSSITIEFAREDSYDITVKSRHNRESLSYYNVSGAFVSVSIF